MSSLGRQKKQPGVWDRAYRLRWDDVRYAPGKLEVVTYRNGKEWARDTVKTTGAPARLVLEAESRTVASDGEDVCYVNVSVRDAEGLVVPNAKLPVSFALEGSGEIVATDNGDETDFGDFHSPSRSTFNGWAQVIVRANRGAVGVLRLTASSDGLKPCTAEIAITDY